MRIRNCALQVRATQSTFFACSGGIHNHCQAATNGHGVCTSFCRCTHLLLHIFDAAAPTTICHLDLQQRQFPVQLAFYMSIIKAQGQTLSMACSCPGPCLHAGSCMSLSCVGPWDIWCSCITAACWPPLCKGRTGHLHHNFVLSGSLIIPFLAISFCFFPSVLRFVKCLLCPNGHRNN